MEDFARVTEGLRNEISALRSTLKEQREYFKTEIADLHRKLNQANTERCQGSQVTDKRQTKQRSHSTVSSLSTSPRQTAQHATSLSSPLSPSPPPTLTAGNLPTTTIPPSSLISADSQDVAETREGEIICSGLESSPSTPPTNTPGVSAILPHSSSAPHSSTTRPCPLQVASASEQADTWPQLPHIHPDTATVILGDSVVSGLHEAKMCISNERTQVLCIPGLARADLLDALKGTKPCVSAATVVIHVGINDCKKGYRLGANTWRAVHAAVKRCFPRARVVFSSILPHKEGH